MFLSAVLFAIHKSDGPSQQFRFLLFSLLSGIFCGCRQLLATNVNADVLFWMYVLSHKWNMCMLAFHYFCLSHYVTRIHFRHTVTMHCDFTYQMESIRTQFAHADFDVLPNFIIRTLFCSLLSLNYIYHSNYKTFWRPHPQQKGPSPLICLSPPPWVKFVWLHLSPLESVINYHSFISNTTTPISMCVLAQHHTLLIIASHSSPRRVLHLITSLWCRGIVYFLWWSGSSCVHISGPPALVLCKSGPVPNTTWIHLYLTLFQWPPSEYICKIKVTWLP